MSYFNIEVETCFQSPREEDRTIPTSGNYFKEYGNHNALMLSQKSRGKNCEPTKTMVWYINGDGEVDQILWDKFLYPNQFKNTFRNDVLMFCYLEDFCGPSLLWYFDNPRLGLQYPQLFAHKTLEDKGILKECTSLYPVYSKTKRKLFLKHYSGESIQLIKENLRDKLCLKA